MKNKKKIFQSIKYNFERFFLIINFILITFISIKLKILFGLSSIHRNMKIIDLNYLQINYHIISYFIPKISPRIWYPTSLVSFSVLTNVFNLGAVFFIFEIANDIPSNYRNRRKLMNKRKSKSITLEKWTKKYLWTRQ